MNKVKPLLLLVLYFVVGHTTGLDISDLSLTNYPAHTLGDGRQLLTSSTLVWADISRVQSGKIPSSRVVLSGISAVCRVRDADKLLPGSTDKSGLCRILNVKYSDYQVLSSAQVEK